MTNFAKQLEAAIDTYAQISGISFDVVAANCADLNSQTAKNVMLLMFAAR